MDDQQAAIEEYKTLRQEILNHQQFVHQINTAGVAIGAGIAAILINRSTIGSIEVTMLCSGLALLYFPLIMSQVYRRRKEMRIGRYIEIIIEPRIPGLYWEKAWHRKNNKDVFNRPALYEAGPLLTLQLLYGLAAFSTAISKNYYIAIIVLVILVAFIFVEVVQIWNLSSIEEFEKEWISKKQDLLPPQEIIDIDDKN